PEVTLYRLTRPRARHAVPRVPFLLCLVLSLVVAACSANTPPARESRPLKPEPHAAGAAEAEPAAVPPPDPREALLSAAMVELLERQHLLRKRIDDELSRTAFATYLDRLDSSKMFLLKKDREALVKYTDKIDDELRSGSLDLAHDGSKIFVARVAVVEKNVAELLAAPFNHSDEEFIELDPKKVEVATTDDELRDRWRRRLELEVMQRVSQMEARLAADKEAADLEAAKDASKDGAGKHGAKDAGKPGSKGAPGKGAPGSKAAAGTKGGKAGASAGMNPHAGTRSRVTDVIKPDETRPTEKPGDRPAADADDAD